MYKNNKSNRDWNSALSNHQKPHAGRASWQLINSVGFYFIILFLAYQSISVSLWLTVMLCILGGGILTRIFIIFHDCTHGSFYKSPLANRLWGRITGFITFTPFIHWQRRHMQHHAYSGNLDKRGIGDIHTMTVSEYLSAPIQKKLTYRLFRHPLILFFVVPIFLFLILQRFPISGASTTEKRSVWLTNIAIISSSIFLIYIADGLSLITIQLGTLFVGSSIGMWLFYVQHQFEDTYWENKEKWNYIEAALTGSSYYELPQLLRWFSGNIGFHHIHHLNPSIPNYNLEKCHNSNQHILNIAPMTLMKSLKSINLRLWDESSKRLISFGELNILTENLNRKQ
ncbi:MAG: fatty acid desaturase [Methylobacter sp.]